VPALSGIIAMKAYDEWLDNTCSRLRDDNEAPVDWTTMPKTISSNERTAIKYHENL
jgi:hypothetical protein